MSELIQAFLALKGATSSFWCMLIEQMILSVGFGCCLLSEVVHSNPGERKGAAPPSSHTKTNWLSELVDVVFKRSSFGKLHFSYSALILIILLLTMFESCNTSSNKCERKPSIQKVVEDADGRVTFMDSETMNILVDQGALTSDSSEQAILPVGMAVFPSLDEKIANIKAEIKCNIKHFEDATTNEDKAFYRTIIEFKKEELQDALKLQAASPQLSPWRDFPPHEVGSPGAISEQHVNMLSGAAERDSALRHARGCPLGTREPRRNWSVSRARGRGIDFRRRNYFDKRPQRR